ncbi:MAG: transposase, partial [Chitinophagaceae bacterium]|nr:transposase [Chitinophagaceae bacterium]
MKTLNELRATFTTQHKCEVYLRKSRWPNGVICPFCGAVHPLWMAKYERWQCKECHKQFTLT